MKTKIAWINVARLVAGILAFVFTVGGALYLYAVIMERTSYGPLFGTYIEEKLHSLGDFFFPLLMTLSTLLLFVYAFFANKKRTLLIIATAALALSFVSLSLFYALYYSEIFRFGIFALLTLLCVFWAFKTKNKAMYTLKIATSVLAIAIYILAAALMIESDFGLYKYAWTAFFIPSTMFVPFIFAVTHCVDKPVEIDEAKEESIVIESQES